MNASIVKAALTIGSVIGVAAVSYISARNLPRAKEIIVKGKEEIKNVKGDAGTIGESEKDYIFQIKLKYAKKAAPLILPVALTVGVTVGCILSINKINAKQIAALTASCTYLAKNRDRLEAKVREEIGEKRFKDLKRTITSENFVDMPMVAEETNRGDVLCFEGYSGRWFRSSVEAVRQAQRDLNFMFDGDRYVCLNDFYDFLGIERTHFGHQFGWVNDPDYYDTEIIFENNFIDMGKGEPVYCIDLYTYPMECWMEV